MIIALNITNEQRGEKAEIPSTKKKKEIEKEIKAEFGEMVTYSKEENCIYVCDNQYLTNPVLIKILAENRIYLQSSLF